MAVDTSTFANRIADAVIREPRYGEPQRLSLDTADPGPQRCRAILNGMQCRRRAHITPEEEQEHLQIAAGVYAGDVPKDMLHVSDPWEQHRTGEIVKVWSCWMAGHRWLP